MGPGWVLLLRKVVVEPAESSHGGRVGLTHHKESTNMALKGFFSFFHLFIDSFFHSLTHSSNMYGGPTVSTAFVGIIREGFIDEVTFEQREPCLASKREPHG